MCNPRAAKERKKPDRVVFDCQERAYWVVHRPPVRNSTHSHTHTYVHMPALCKHHPLAEWK